MSVSITPTRKPAFAVNTAILAVVFDLPVPPLKECVDMILANITIPDPVMKQFDYSNEALDQVDNTQVLSDAFLCDRSNLAMRCRF
jgi:hypothetical protein